MESKSLMQDDGNAAAQSNANSSVPLEIIRTQADPSAARQAALPSLLFALLLFLGALLLHLTLLSIAHRNVAEIAFTIYDNSFYLEVADRLQHFGFQSYEPKHFWGFPVAIMLVSWLLRIPEVSALILVCFVSGVLAVHLSYKLYGGYVASLFAVGNYLWLTYCLEGSSEPLFAALVYGGSLSLRSQSWMLAGLLLGFATVVRGVAFLALLCVGIVLLGRRKYRELAITAVPAAVVGLAYLALLYRATGDPFVQFKSYSSLWGGGWWLFSWPVITSVRALALLPMTRWTDMVYRIFWLVLTFVGLCAMCLGRPYRVLWRERPIEAAFGLVYAMFFASFNRPPDGGIDSRLIGPILPMILVSFGRWAQWNRIALVGLGVLAGVLSACAMAGFHAIFGFGLP